jgi:hypothetical protein
MDSPSITERAERPYFSTGHLPDPETVQELVSDAHGRFKTNTNCQNSQVHPALARVPSELFGICTTATPQQVMEVVPVNTDARLRALKIRLLVLAALALLAIIPAGRLPNYLPGDIPSDDPAGKAARST